MVRTKSTFSREMLKLPIKECPMPNSKIFRLKLEDSSGEVYLNVCPHCYNNPAVTEIYNLADSSNFRKHENKHNNEESPSKNTIGTFSDCDDVDSGVSSESKKLNEKLRNKFSKYGCYSDVDDSITITKRYEKIVNELLHFGKAYPITGCWIYNGKDCYRQFLEMKIPMPLNESQQFCLHSALCEVGHDLTNRSDAHVRCCRPSHLRWGSTQENTLDRDSRQIMEQDKEFFDICKNFQNQVLQIYSEMKSISIQDLKQRNENYSRNNLKNSFSSTSFSSFSSSISSTNSSISPSRSLSSSFSNLNTSNNSINFETTTTFTTNITTIIEEDEKKKEKEKEEEEEEEEEDRELNSHFMSLLIKEKKPITIPPHYLLPPRPPLPTEKELLEILDCEEGVFKFELTDDLKEMLNNK
ncbi:CTD small phosphatase-like protein 2 [Tieghemostelium lacteum]|uniref:CTD small phosphatase-like protein 2 n=1 Tax=Tieghemostelium lacteum TaxID=361077 RepID=A0A151ZDX7_TIELA|nr:CTD small phosphatase-like protein 2 [Tieghemostelium lacteum]|eukprot:KYQ92094.1 CTD small phosphatase-like protein 2 [Tieghemostelium lacteum]